MDYKEVNQIRIKKGVSYSHLQRELKKAGIIRTVQNIRQILLGERASVDADEILKAINKILK